MENNDTILSEFIPRETEVSFIQGLLTRIIDIALEIALLFFFYTVLPRPLLMILLDSTSFMRWIIVIALVAFYQFSFLFLFNKTPGMMICQVKYLNRDLQPLSKKEKLLSLFRGRYSSIRFYKEK